MSSQTLSSVKRLFDEGIAELLQPAHTALLRQWNKASLMGRIYIQKATMETHQNYSAN